MQTNESILSWVCLAEILGPRSRRLKPLLQAFGTPEGIFSADEKALLSVMPDMGAGLLAKIKAGGDRREAERILRYCEKAGVTLLTPDNPLYPACFFALREPPAVVYAKGNLTLPRHVPYVGVVGTRKADAYGMETAYRFAFELAGAGAVVVSGMAEGIDGVAAVAAMEAGGFTVAVLGTGIDRVYPKHHKRLAGEIAEFGLLLSEFAPGTPPNARNFPIRNRLISALSEAVLVVEADDDSGSLITARYALLQGKSLFAVPGDVNRKRSEGCNLLLQAGAHMALESEDVLSHFRFLYRQNVKVPAEAVQYAGVTEQKLRAHGVKWAGDEIPKKEKHQKRETVEEASTPAEQKEENNRLIEEAVSRLDEAKRNIYAMLPDTPFTVDALVSAELSAGEVIAAMTLFEVYGLVSSRPGGVYRKTTLL